MQAIGALAHDQDVQQITSVLECNIQALMSYLTTSILNQNTSISDQNTKILNLVQQMSSMDIPPRKASGLYTDPFTRNMEVHPEVPEWWFMVTLVVSLVMYILMVKAFPETHTPVWSVFFAVVLNIIFIILFGPLYATTNVFLEVGPLIQILMGYMTPHNANAMMITQCVANNVWEQA